MPTNIHDQEFTEDATDFCNPSTELLRKTKASPQACITIIAGPQVGDFYYVSRNSGVTFGSSIDADVQISDKGVSRKHTEIYWDNRNTFLVDLQSSNGTYLNGEKIAKKALIKDGDQIIIGSSTIIKFNISNQLDIDYQKRISEQITRDSLTRTYNKRALLEILHREFQYAIRHKKSLCVLMLDIDHFKRINDTYGHTVGDYMLIHLANTLRSLVRTEDYVCRFGGEEFTIICRDLNLKSGHQLAQRILSVINSSPLHNQNQEIAYSVSIGLASYPEFPAESINGLLKDADEALYKAKYSGRNRVCMNI